jgi:ankyrin repeat/BTB/POZ domain-containing protein 1
MVLNKHAIEAALYEENQDVRSGRLKEDSPLDLSKDFEILCEACRRGDLRICQEQITIGVNINARDKSDYTPLILV